MKGFKHYLTTNEHIRRGFYVFIVGLFLSIIGLILFSDSEILEGLVIFLLCILGLNVGIYMYIEEVERKLRTKRKTDGMDIIG